MGQGRSLGRSSTRLSTNGWERASRVKSGKSTCVKDIAQVPSPRQERLSKFKAKGGWGVTKEDIEEREVCRKRRNRGF